jgi:hypothetical protein
MLEVIKLIPWGEECEDAAKEIDSDITEAEQVAFNKTHPIDFENANSFKKEIWSEYRQELFPATIKYFEAVRHYLTKNNLRKGGFWHQNEGILIFNDGKVFSMTFRAWGAFAAAVWNTEEKHRRYCYTDFAWDDPPLYSHVSWNKTVARQQEWEKFDAQIFEHARHGVRSKLKSKTSNHVLHTRHVTNENKGFSSY